MCCFHGYNYPYSVRGSSNKESKLDEDLNIYEFYEDEQDSEAIYRKLLKDSMCLSHVNDKLSSKLIISVSQNYSLTSELDDAHAKIS